MLETIQWQGLDVLLHHQVTVDTSRTRQETQTKASKATEEQVQLRDMADLPVKNLQATQEAVVITSSKFFLQCKSCKYETTAQKPSKARKQMVKHCTSLHGKVHSKADTGVVGNVEIDNYSSNTSETKAQEDTTLLSSYTASILPLAKQELEVEHETVDNQLVEPAHQQDGDYHDEQFEQDFNACLSMVQRQAQLQGMAALP